MVICVSRRYEVTPLSSSATTISGAWTPAAHARRLTAGLGEPGTPVLSPDGKWIAYVGRDEQHPEVYLMHADGGPARRMTWLGPDVLVRGWTPEGRILFVTTHGQPFFRNYRAFTLGIDGGLPEMLPYGQVNHLAFGPGKAKVIGRNTAEPARWKRYRGGTAGHFWIDASGTGTFRRMTKLAGNLTSPMWIGKRIYFISDGEGVGNLYSCRPDGSDQRRHTDHDIYYARNAQTDGTRIVYQCGADIWLFDHALNRTAPVEIDAPSHRTQATRKFVNAADHLDGYSVHPAGHSLAINPHGKFFTIAMWEGAVRQHGGGWRSLSPRVAADGKLVGVSDEGGDERVVVMRDGKTTTLPWDVGRVLAMRCARGKGIALSNHRNRCSGRCRDEEGVARRLRRLGSRDLAWSPDGVLLAYSF